MTAEAQTSPLASELTRVAGGSKPDARPLDGHRTRLAAWQPTLVSALPVVAVLGLAAILRFWQLDKVGFSSDEAV